MVRAMTNQEWLNLEGIEVKGSGLMLVFEAMCIEGSYEYKTKFMKTIREAGLFMKTIRGTGFKNDKHRAYIDICGEWLEVDPATVKIIFQEREVSGRK